MGDPAQLLAENCPQCESMSPAEAIGAMEPEQFAAAWKRAVDWNRGRLTEVSATEVPLLLTLVALNGQFSKRGFEWGAVPSGERAVSAA